MNTEPHEITRYFATAFQVISKYDLLLSSHIGFFFLQFYFLSVSNLFMICFPYAISNLNYIHLYSDKEVFGLQIHNKNSSYFRRSFSLSMFHIFSLLMEAHLISATLLHYIQAEMNCVL